MTEPTLDCTDAEQHPTDARSVDTELPGLQSDLDQLLTDIADADRVALTKLYGLVSARLFGIQMRILKNRELAEDALQEAFIKVWNTAAACKSSQGTPMAWLNSLARSQALDMLRRAAMRAAVNVKIPDLNVDAWRDKARHFPDEMAELDALTRCLQTLPEESQACIVGLYCEGHAQEEMSQAREQPMETVKRKNARGQAVHRATSGHGTSVKGMRNARHVPPPWKTGVSEPVTGSWQRFWRFPHSSVCFSSGRSARYLSRKTRVCIL